MCSSRLYKPHRCKAQTLRNNRPHTPPDNDIFINFPGSFDTPDRGNPSVQRNVDIQVDKQRPDASIHLIFIGGQGEDYVQNIMMRVTRSDGTVEEKYLSDGTRRPRPYDELVMDGTRGVDQVEVFLTSLGKTYKIFDKPLAYPMS